MMMLVVDVVKGMQTQTAECLVIGEVTCKRMVVVLNKVDLIPEDKRSSVIEKVCIFCRYKNIGKKFVTSPNTCTRSHKQFLSRG